MKKILSGPTNFLVIPFVLLLFVFFHLPAKVSAANIEIYTLEDLDDVRNDLTDDYILMNDLDFQNDANYENIANKNTWTTGEGWETIGSYENPFTGSFDGQDHTISNLFMTKSTGDNIGLFSSIESAVITNLSLSEINITALDSWYVGGLSGYSSNSSISNCNVGGSIDASDQVGGLIGRNEETSINNCSSTVDISGEDSLGGLIGFNQDAGIENSSFSGSVTSAGGSNIGGLIGYNGLLITSDRTTITNCHTSGSVTGTYSVGGLVGDNSESDITSCYSASSVNGQDYPQSVGGLVGDNNEGDIFNSYATGNVITDGGSYGVGGLVGDDWGNVYDSYATGNVIGDDGVGGLLGGGDGIVNNSYATGNVSEVAGGYEDGYAIGGLIGYHYSGEINKSYSVGVVTAFTTDDVGGFIGLKEGEVTVSDSFWNTETSGSSTSAGGTGKTTTEMQTISTFNNTATIGLDTTWDISLIENFDELNPTTWFIDQSNDYPRLSIQYVAGEGSPDDPGDDPSDTPDGSDDNPSDTETSFSANLSTAKHAFSIKTPTCTNWAPTNAPYLFQVFQPVAVLINISSLTVVRIVMLNNMVLNILKVTQQASCLTPLTCSSQIPTTTSKSELAMVACLVPGAL